MKCKKGFQARVGGEGHDTSQKFEGSFGSMRALLHVRPQSEQKPRSGQKEIELSYCHHSICRQKTNILNKRTSKLDEK